MTAHSNKNIERILILGLAVSMQLGCFVIQINRLPYFLFMITAAVLLFGFEQYKNRKVLLPGTVYELLAWLIFCTVNALMISPYMLGYCPKILRILFESAGVIVIIFFFVMAYNLCLRNTEKIFLKYLSYTAVIIAFFSLFIKAGTDSRYVPLFYYFGERFSGLAGNPNDYMAVVFVAVAYFCNRRTEKLLIRLIALSVLLYSMLASGSKGGVVAIGVYVFLFLLEKEWEAGKRNRKLIFLILLQAVLGAAVLFYFALPILLPYLERLGINKPGLDRILYLIANLKQGLSADGSLRIEAWVGTLEIIRRSPILGVGIGGFTRILDSIQYPYSTIMPHNIYLELLSQSGLPIFIVVAVSFCRALRRSLYVKTETVRIIRHGLYLLLADGFFMAADWFPIFWILTGMLLYHVHQNTKKSSRGGGRT